MILELAEYVPMILDTRPTMIIMIQIVACKNMKQKSLVHWSQSDKQAILEKSLLVAKYLVMFLSELL